MQMSQVEPMALTITQVANALGLSRPKVYRLIYQEHLPVVRMGRSVRVLPGSLQEWLRRREKAN